MRNAQLVRQWKILRYIAEGQFDLVNLDLPELHEVFKRSYKTIRRDIHGLFLAGFLSEYKFYTESTAPTRKKLKPAPELRTTVRRMEELSGSTLAGLDLLRCNSCPYRFKTKDGRLDMVDFRAHKGTHK